MARSRKMTFEKWSLGLEPFGKRCALVLWSHCAQGFFQPELPLEEGALKLQPLWGKAHKESITPRETQYSGSQFPKKGKMPSPDAFIETGNITLDVTFARATSDVNFAGSRRQTQLMVLETRRNGALGLFGQIHAQVQKCRKIRDTRIRNLRMGDKRCQTCEPCLFMWIC